MPQVRLDETRGRWVLAAAVLGSGTALFDTTAVNLALPVLGRELGADFSDLQWTINAYTLALASLLLLGGALGDRYGRRRVFLVGTVWFAAASVLCGLAPSIELLIAARLLQGVGAALLVPGSLALLQASFARGDRGRAIGLWSALTALAAAAGPLGGGLLVELSWRLVFLTNVPLCAVVVLVTLRHVPESRDEESAPSLDVAGAAVGAGTLGALTYGLISAGEAGLTPFAVAALVAGVLGLGALVLVERRAADPLVPLELFRVRQFSAANAVTLAVYAALGGFFLLVVVELQVVLGLSPLLAGSGLLPVTLALLVLSPRAGAWAERHGPRVPMALGPLVAACGALLLVRVGPASSYWVDVLPAVAVFGLGLGVTVAPLTATALGALEDRYAGVASGVNNAVARTAGLLAVAALPTLAGISGDDYTSPDAFAPGFRIAMVAAAVLLALGGVLAALLITDEAATENV